MVNADHRNIVAADALIPGALCALGKSATLDLALETTTTLRNLSDAD